MGDVGITAALAARLVAEQFPQWAGLPVVPVESDGWDNRTFRLGDEMSVRLPSGPHYALQAEKEHRWLPVLAPSLPVSIPESLALGRPGDGFPWTWSVRRRLPGTTIASEPWSGSSGVARDLAGFLVALHAIDTDGGPRPGAHNFHRGGSLDVYDKESRAAIRRLGRAIDTQRAVALWEMATTTTWGGPAVWVHGDLTPSNLLGADGRLSAVIDFGACAVGDPACDLAVAWTAFAGDSRDAFLRGVDVDDDTRARARGWALWKALVTRVQGSAGAEAARLRFGWRWPADEVVEQLVGEVR